MGPKSRLLCCLLAVALVGVVVTTGVDAAGAAGTKPTATDVGITATEIHIAVIADVENSIVPDLFKPTRDAVEGFAQYINSKAGGGGLAGRKLVVDFYDSKLNANSARNATISACANDVAMVGTAASLLNSVDDMRACKDSTGTATGIPDIPFVATAVPQQCSDQSFPISPPGLVCSTAADHPQTYQANVGRGYYYKNKFGDLHGAYVFGNLSKSARATAFSSGIGQLRTVCCTSDQDFDISPFSPQSALTPAVLKMKSDGSNFGSAVGPPLSLLLRKEATLQGLTGVKVWDCTSTCYTSQFIGDGGSDVEGQYVDLPFLPFFDKREQANNKMLANYVKYVGSDNVAGYGVYGWAAAAAFADAVNVAVKAHGVNGLTRATIFDALNTIHAFNAGGMIGTIDLAGRKTSPCHVLLQVQKGAYRRILPTTPGTMDCTQKNVVQVKLDLVGT